MGTWGTIIFIIIALWGVISQVLEAAARKAKERKRIEELEQKAARELGVTVPQPATAATKFEMHTELPGPRKAEPLGRHAALKSTPPTAAQRTTQSRPQPQRQPQQQHEADLAARRREQIEQLRQRRLTELRSRTGLGSTSSVGVPAPPGPMRTTQKQRAAKGKRGARPSQPAGQPASTSYRAGRSLEGPMDSSEVAAVAGTAVVESLVAHLDQPFKESYGASAATRGGGRPGEGQPGRTALADLAALRRLLADPYSLRQLFIAKEILDAPLGLREQ